MVRTMVIRRAHIRTDSRTGRAVRVAAHDVQQGVRAEPVAGDARRRLAAAAAAMADAVPFEQDEDEPLTERERWVFDYARQRLAERGVDATVDDDPAWVRLPYGGERWGVGDSPESVAEAILAWQKTGMSPDEVRTWLPGFPQPHFMKWIEAGFTDRASIASWVRLARDRAIVARATAWRDEGFTPEEALDWVENGFVTLPDIRQAGRLRADEQGAAEAGRERRRASREAEQLRGSGVDPA